MRNNLIRIVSIICIFALTVTCFAGCGKIFSSGSDKKTDGTGEVKPKSTYALAEGVKMDIINTYKRDCKPTVTEDKIPGTDIAAIKIEAFEGGSLIFTGPAGRLGGVDWRYGKYITIPFYSEETHSSNLRFVFKEDPSSGFQTEFLVGFMPGFIVNHSIALNNFDLQNLFMDRLPGVVKNSSWGTPTDPTKITYMEIVLPWSAKPYTIWLADFTMTDAAVPATLPATPIVDEIGQWKDKKWTGKTKNTKEMTDNLKAWAAENYQSPNPNFDAYGGNSNMPLTATGYFHTQFSGNRWWLVDPIGNAFFSTGIDCVIPSSPGPVTGGLAPLLDWTPASSETKYNAAWTDGHGTHLSFTVTNLIRAFGKDDYFTKWETMTAGRMRAWGMNTVGNWSADGFGTRNTVPYVTQMTFPTTGAKVFRDFPDVFSNAYQSSATTAAASLQGIAADPYCIGYFLNNEPQWQFAEGYIADYLFANSASLVTKTVAIDYLRQQYGTIAALNDAWDKEFTSFNDLTRSIPNVSSFTERAREDIVDISVMMVDEYIRVPSEAARRVAPNHLNLGIRWGGIQNDTLLSGTRYLDVFSLNHYAAAPDLKVVGRITKLLNIPVIIGEFHSGSLDSGLMSNGLIGNSTQEERGKYYAYYVENLAALPGVVGTHYFQLNDQPILGRFDGENYQIGFVDVCNKPYADFIAEVIKTNKKIYDVCAGTTPPTTQKPVITVSE